MSDSVNKPSHYNAGGVETIDGIKAALGDGFSDYCLGNVLKYVWRCKHKGKLIEDLRKASKYLEWAIEEAEGNCPKMPDSSSGEPLAIPEGWRELEIGEALSKKDLYCRDGKWNPYVESNPAGSDFPKYSKGIHYRHIRKIETANSSETPNSSTWIPKVGDRVRVNCPGRIAHNKAGLIIDVPNSKYAVRIEHEKLTTFNLKAEHLELIEAAS